MKRFAAASLAMLLLLSGCSVFTDIRENHELDRALAFQSPVSCGRLSALTPQVSLLLENQADTLVLRLAASPRRYTATLTTRRQFSAYIEAAHHAGKQVDLCDATEGVTTEVFLLRFEAGGKVWGEYVTLVQAGSELIMATYLDWGLSSQPASETRWTEVPAFFARFVGSLRVDK